MTACTWAACPRDSVLSVDGWPMCEPHRHEHEDMKKPERPCRDCGEPIGTMHARRLVCDDCQQRPVRKPVRKARVPVDGVVPIRKKPVDMAFTRDSVA